MLSLRDLEYFVEVARRGQLAQAAAALAVTPAALSKGIRRLEEELGLALFERSGQGMALTAFGRTFVPQAERMRSHHDEALRHAGDVRAGRAGQLRVGATIAVLEPVISPALARLQPRRPSLRVKLAIASSDEVLERAREGQLDVAIAPAYGAAPHGLDHVDLGIDALVPVARRGHPLFRKRSLAAKDFGDLSWILPRESSAARHGVDAAFAACGIPLPRAAIEVDANSSWALPLLRNTDLVALVPRSALGHRIGGDLRVLDLEALKVERTITAFWRAGMPMSPLMKEFIAELPREGPRRAP